MEITRTVQETVYVCDVCGEEGGGGRGALYTAAALFDHGGRVRVGDVHDSCLGEVVAMLRQAIETALAEYRALRKLPQEPRAPWLPRVEDLPELAIGGTA